MLRRLIPLTVLMVFAGMAALACGSDDDLAPATPRPYSATGGAIHRRTVAPYGFTVKGNSYAVLRLLRHHCANTPHSLRCATPRPADARTARATSRANAKIIVCFVMQRKCNVLLIRILNRKPPWPRGSKNSRLSRPPGKLIPPFSRMPILPMAANPA